jgi:aminoglycoside/choline kinase family phosphotransferase
MTSTSSSDLLLHQTRIRFPAFSDAKVNIAPIEKGGSDRRFYRVRFSPEQTIILVKYNLEREENRLYVQIAEFLAEHKIRAPKVYFHDSEEGLIWIEDLGEIDLWHHREETWLVRRSLYESALDQAARLHSLPPASAQDIRPHLAAEFNAALYLWEQNYFFENCLGRYFGLSGQQIAELADLPALSESAQRLGDLPRVLVHRDFQSQNIIVRNGQAHLIDFQGMRPGLAEYDLASLLYDPYVTLSADERTQLLEYYSIARGDKSLIAPEILELCAMQRLMQALGAYGFLGLVKGSRPFLRYIGPAIESLHSLIASQPRLKKLERALAALSLNGQTR